MTTYEVQEGQGVVGGQAESPQGQSYFSTSYYANQGAEEAQNLEGLAGAQNTIEELSKKLGVDPSSLAGEEAVQPEQAQVEPEAPAEDYLAKFNTEEGKRFRAEFKNYMGIDPVEAYTLITQTSDLVQHLDGWRREVQQERQMETLRREFGADFDSVMPKVVERFSKLPKAQQVALDNVDGARMLAAIIREEELSQSRGRPNPYASTNVRPLQRGGNTSPVIRMSEMLNWDDATVQARMPDIIKAKQNGTFINDY
jgi:hypothetical protein